jgi:hypothetical protein
MTKELPTYKVRLDLTEREIQLLKDMLFEETQTGTFNGSHLARCIIDKLEANER